MARPKTTAAPVDASTLSRNLVHLRKVADLSQYEVAEKTGISRSSIQKYENGSWEPNHEHFESLATFFHLTPRLLKTVDLARLKADDKRMIRLQIRDLKKKLERLEAMLSPVHHGT